MRYRGTQRCVGKNAKYRNITQTKRQGHSPPGPPFVGSPVVYQHNDVSKIEQNLNKNFSNICNWFVHNKLSIYFGEDKTKCILFGTKNLNKNGSLKIRHGTIQIKQCHTVTYLGCALDKNLSGEIMALSIISKINCRLRFLYRKKQIFIVTSSQTTLQRSDTISFRLCMLSLVSQPEQQIEVKITNTPKQMHSLLSEFIQ